MEGISWKILWLHSDCSARSFVLIRCSLGFSWGESSFSFGNVFQDGKFGVKNRWGFSLAQSKLSLNCAVMNFIVLWIEIMHPFPIFLELMGLDDDGRQSIPIKYTHVSLHTSEVYSFLPFPQSIWSARYENPAFFRSGAAFAKSFAYHLARSLGRKVRFDFGDSERFESPSRAV